VRPGQEYTLRLPADRLPKSYSMTYIDPKTGKEGKEQDVAWPAAEENYFLLTIPRYRGDLDKRFEVIKEPAPGATAQVPNPFKDIRRDLDIRMYLGSIGASLPEPDAMVVENRLVLRQASLPKRAPERVWIQMPIAESELAGAIAAVKDIPSKQFSAQIRKNSVPATDAGAAISPDSGAKWYELPKAGDRFERSLALSDWKGLQEKYPRVYQLVVWEFDDGTTRQPIAVNEGGRDSPFKVVEIESWPRGLQELKRFEERGSAAGGK